MTTSQETEFLTRIGPGTPMGQLMREYWMPAAKSTELTTDGPPMRLMLLGEKLIAFRDSSGRIGVMDHRCPHRCASLYFGRNEDGGIRCAYHGWKFDLTGACVDQANLPDKFQFASKVKVKAYPAVERNGIIWVYMGARSVPPALPAIEAMLLPEQEVSIYFAMRECNWLQSLEGDIDTSHIAFLHFGGTKAEEVHDDSTWRLTLQYPKPEYEVMDTPWGTAYGAFRPGFDPAQNYWRVSHFMFPFWTIVPEGNFADYIFARAWVPMDDTHTMFIYVIWNGITATPRHRKDGTPLPGANFELDQLPNTTGWYGRWRLAQNEDNDYLLDREEQRNVTYSGIPGLYAQDQALIESIGPIADHSLEHLAVSDRMIIATRRRLSAAVRALAENGTVPPGVDEPDAYRRARGGEFFAPRSMPFNEAYDRELRAASDPTGGLQAAE